MAVNEALILEKIENLSEKLSGHMIREEREMSQWFDESRKRNEVITEMQREIAELKGARAAAKWMFGTFMSAVALFVAYLGLK